MGIGGGGGGGGCIFNPRAIICTILVEVYKIKLHAKYQRLSLLVSDKKNILKFCL